MESYSIARLSGLPVSYSELLSAKRYRIVSNLNCNLRVFQDRAFDYDRQVIREHYRAFICVTVLVAITPRAFERAFIHIGVCAFGDQLHFHL